MRIACTVALGSLLVLGGCDSGSGTDGPLAFNGTVASLSAGSGPTVVSLQWLFDEGMGDTQESGGTVPAPKTLPASFDLPVQLPAHYMIDFDVARALPDCSPTDTTGARCWPSDRPRVQGHGKLAIGVVLAFDDTDGNGQWSKQPTEETIRGLSPLFLFYTQGLDAQAQKELGQLTLLNPQALRPGFNFARVRCKDKVGWSGRFDPFEVVGAEAITVESREALDAKVKAGELCTNWT
jgi:hypothetical protein